jgi:hypothetical protein
MLQGAKAPNPTQNQFLEDLVIRSAFPQRNPAQMFLGHGFSAVIYFSRNAVHLNSILHFLTLSKKLKDLGTNCT